MTDSTTASRSRALPDGYLQQPGEPEAASFSASLSGQMRRYWLALRPPFFTASIMPVVVGTAWGAMQGASLSLLSAILATLCMVLGHGAGNLFNDVHDDITGNDAQNTDRIYPFSGGSRFIQNGVMSRRTMWIYGLVLLGLTTVPGLYLLVQHGWGIAGFGAVLFGLLVLHHVPPVKLSYRGFAELIIALSFGVVPVLMAIWLQSGALTWTGILVSVPVAMWVANILLINEIPDRDADARTGKKTFVVLFGAERSRALHKAANGTAFAACLLLAAMGYLSVWGLIGAAVLLGLGLRAANLIDGADRERLTGAIKTTIGVHALGSLWLTGWIVLS